MNTKFWITLLFGWSGIHKIMDKKYGTGILYFFTFGLFGIGWIVDIIAVATDKGGTYKIDVVGESYHKDDILSIAKDNPIFSYTDEQFIEKVAENKHIYKYKYQETEARLVPEPNNPHDPNAIMVLVGSAHVGYIPAARCHEIKKILNRVKSVTAHIRGGDYKYHSGGEVFKLQSDFSIKLEIKF